MLGSGVGGRGSCYPDPPDANYDSRAPQKFTGKERDVETGLDYFLARYYSGAQGRFMRPDDPFVDQFPEDPQSWNLYAYTRNNPLRFVDPTGNACRVAEDGTEYDDDNEGSSCAEVHEADGEEAKMLNQVQSLKHTCPVV
jgi:RHS repeat-associated protein